MAHVEERSQPLCCWHVMKSGEDILLKDLKPAQARFFQRLYASDEIWNAVQRISDLCPNTPRRCEGNPRYSAKNTWDSTGLVFPRKCRLDNGRTHQNLHKRCIPIALEHVPGLDGKAVLRPSRAESHLGATASIGCLRCSTHWARQEGASNGSPKYCVSRVHFPFSNSMMLTVYTGFPS